MKNNNKNIFRFPIKRYTSALLVFWTIMVLSSLLWNINEEEDQVIQFAKIQAESLFDKDLLYRRWNAGHGGVYVPVIEETAPNPYLEGLVSERDITTHSGKKLTLINPAYMTRQVHELGKTDKNVYGHITSLKPIRPENAADPWETEALKSFELGKKEAGVVAMIDGKEYFRFMGALVTEKRCLKCHEKQGYKEGDIRGGISVSVPMAEHRAILAGHIKIYFFEHFTAWLFGICLIIFGSLWIIRNDRMRQNAEDVLIKSEEKYRYIYKNTPAMMHSINSEGKLVSVSEHWLRVLGYEEDEVIGRRSTDFLTEASRKYAKDVVLPNFFKTGICRDIHYQFVKKNGEAIDVLLSAISEKDEAGNVRSLAMIIDITERKRAEEERERLSKKLDEKNRELEQVVYVTSHDLRSPLVNVHGYSKELGRAVAELMSALTRNGISNEVMTEVEEYVRDIPESINYVNAGIDKMNSLLNGLLQYSRTGKRELIIEDLDMNKLMSQAAGTFLFQIKETGVKLDVSDLPSCRGDADQIDQVFSNLIGNAFKYLDPERSGSIKISGDRSEGRSVYCVEDNGIGIAPDDQERIFAIFNQLDMKVTGEGLGLTIVKKIVEKHGGEVWVESEEGKGSKFFVALPNKAGDRV